MKNTYFYLSVFCLSFVLFSSCDNFEGKQEIPAYLKINKIEVKESGSKLLTSDIRGVLVKAINVSKNKEEIIGSFELPCEIPILLEGEVVISISPVVVLDLNVATQTTYPFLATITDTVTLKQGETTCLDSVIYTTYQIAPRWVENFEDISTGFNKNNITIINSPVKSGSGAGFIGFESSDTVDFYTIEDFYIPSNERAYGLCLEFDYWTTDVLYVEITGFDKYSNALITARNQLQIPTVKDGSSPEDTDSWRKIYVSLHSLWDSQFNVNENFKIGLWARKNKNSTHSGVYIDNIKLFHSRNIPLK